MERRWSPLNRWGHGSQQFLSYYRGDSKLHAMEGEVGAWAWKAKALNDEGQHERGEVYFQIDHVQF